MLLMFIGVLTGILSGMGVGGGILLVPILTIFFHTPQQVAQGAILASFLLTAPVALFNHYKNGYIKLHLTLYLASTALFGAIGGAWLANNIQAAWLQKAFAVFLLVMGIYQTFSKAPSSQKKPKDKQK